MTVLTSTSLVHCVLGMPEPNKWTSEACGTVHFALGKRVSPPSRNSVNWEQDNHISAEDASLAAVRQYRCLLKIH